MILKNKNILITGAGKGIGFECVKNCIKEGAFVYALIKDRRDIKKSPASGRGSWGGFTYECI